MTKSPLWYRIPEPVIDLLRRIKAVEARPQGWSDGVAADVVTEWFFAQGIDPTLPSAQIPTAEPEHLYERLVRVRVHSPVPLDTDDLDDAIRAAVTGTGVRVEHADAGDTWWVGLEVTEVADVRAPSA